MATLENLSVWRYLGMLVLIIGVLVGGTWITVKTTSDYLLYQGATRAAQNWAQFLAANVSDLEQIAAGETPSSASLAFFNSVRKSGEVFRYTIFNRYGYSMLLSDRDKITPADLSQYSAGAALSVKEDRPIVDAHAGRTPDQPKYFSEAFVPVLVNGRPVATVAAYVDQTNEHDSFYRAFTIAAAALCGLTAVAFAIPAVAWYHRTREKQLAERRISFLAHHDALTGLANRARLIVHLDSALAALPSTGQRIAVHFVDLDHFKHVNDALGHTAGDFLLTTVGRRLIALTRVEDFVARLGGDEFVVVQMRVKDEQDAAAFARRIAAALCVPISFEGQEIKTSVTIGVALGPDDGTTSERLLKSADIALYSGKAAGRNCIRLFTPAMDEALQAHLTLEKTIRDAIANNGFILYYQPLFEISDRRLVGFEALVRLPAADGSLIPPGSFIPVAEDMRVIGILGAWVLREACRTAKTWPKHLTVAVNLSPMQFEDGRIHETVAGVLEESALEPHRLELEITEELLLGNSEAVMAQLRKLKALGTSIVMDDFGTGYSSLSYLWKFPFDKIKIDRSFIEGFGKSDRNAETVVKTIIALGRELHMRVTVEGVETEKQADFLHEAEADQVQGFYFGRPMPASELSADVLNDFQRSVRPRTAGTTPRLVKP